MNKALNIIVDEKHSEAIQKALDEVQAKARVRTLSAQNVIRFCESCTNHLRIPKKYLEGCEMQANPHAEIMPNRYKGIPESTQFSAVFRNGNWHITEVKRDQMRGNKQQAVFSLTDAAKAKIIECASVYYGDE